MLDIAPTGKGGEGVGDQGAGYLKLGVRWILNYLCKFTIYIKSILKGIVVKSISDIERR